MQGGLSAVVDRFYVCEQCLMVFLEPGLVCFISCHAIVQAVDQCLLGLETILLGGLIKDLGFSQVTIQFFVFYQIAVVACCYKFLATVISF